MKSTKSKPYKCNAGATYPIGASITKKGVNFVVFSNAEQIELLLFDKEEDTEASTSILLDKQINKTFYYWHIEVEGLRAGQLYAYRAHGNYAPWVGKRYEGKKVLVDPYAKAVSAKLYDRKKAFGHEDNIAHAIKSVVIDDKDYDWEGDRHINRKYETSVIYEMHVKGFTKHSSSGLSEDMRGTYRGVIEKIPHLKELGITAVELMPIHFFDWQDIPEPRSNYWGYSPINFFSPHPQYAMSEDPVEMVKEFKDMVKAFHKAGIEVILDVVFNHSAESSGEGPNISFRGFDNLSYYMLNPHDRSKELDFTGCGNTLNANHSIVRRMIRDSLRYWVTEMHIDGFRFDLASVLSRDENGHPIQNPPIIWEIESDPVLAGTKIIAEAWDAGGLYQVGSFTGDRWAEWNGVYRDDIRKFVRGEAKMVSNVASRILGSPDVYTEDGREVCRSIHFVTCHDGFTLNDLVSYNEKHNRANGESNRDGMNENYSWNCGVEGPTTKEEVEALRIRQIKNLMTITMISQGTPMILMGDEVRRTQQGNNNAYCQDNEIGWFDWNLKEVNQEIYDFTRHIIKFSQTLSLFRQEFVLHDQPTMEQAYNIWHGVKRNEPDWEDYVRTLSFELVDEAHGERLHVMMNFFWEPLTFEVPFHKKGKAWFRVVDTALGLGKDIIDPRVNQEKIKALTYELLPRSIVILMERND
ncbi:glycogen debranching protein GlgX [Persicobacter sp. CCB-QB2]|uniref:glycogen debranching protein GlgX n=1 Tax=Persicobacter sp. CCB-QB2 TaxID=1561025 RepID=UPI0006A9FEA5|nr:glycogen debranching protein GlgX [Persicobacter sp. CCB-QB2]